MKQLTCEMCGGTDLLKQDGVFVCQTCGCKYSVEEARKMMGEVSSTPVEVKNAAQLENLLNLAKSSFESKNYTQAENFCNQVIAIDGKNYEAWKLKGEAISLQVSITGSRYLEIYNCIMTAYRVLPDEEKKIKNVIIISSLKSCLTVETGFWVKRCAVGRPTEEAINQAITTYMGAFGKLFSAFEEVGLKDSTQKGMLSFINSFILSCYETCSEAWQSTVAYNYYREYMGHKSELNARGDQRWIIPDTSLYRPGKQIWNTFLNESNNLVKLLRFAENLNNEDTDPELIKAICDNIIQIEECAIPSASWEITQGYTGYFEEYKTVGWHEEYTLTAEAKDYRRGILNEYRNKRVEIPQQIIAKKRKKEEQERNERITKYWEKHTEEKTKLEQEQNDLARQMDELKTQISAIEQKNAAALNQLREERDKQLPCEVEVSQQRDVIRELEARRAKCGIFKGREKKTIQARLDNEERPKLESLKKIADDEKTIHHQKVDAQIAAIKEEGKELREEVAKLKKRSDEITAELTKDRE